MIRQMPGRVPNWKDAQIYIDRLFAAEDRHLREALRRSGRAGLPPISVSASEGRLLQVLARAANARRILEVGTLGGYSAIWLARALPPGGTLVTLELWPEHAAVARENIKRAGLSRTAEVRVGHALPLMKQMVADHEPAFDLVFIDADKENNSAYVQWAIDLGREGTVIVVDNVVRNGRILDPAPDDHQARAVRDMLEMMGRHPRLDTAAIQTLGFKGWDGFAVGLVK